MAVSIRVWGARQPDGVRGQPLSKRLGKVVSHYALLRTETSVQGCMFGGGDASVQPQPIGSAWPFLAAGQGGEVCGAADNQHLGKKLYVWGGVAYQSQHQLRSACPGGWTKVVSNEGQSLPVRSCKFGEEAASGNLISLRKRAAQAEHR
eukprot:scaffold133460_cov20-Tisochrysis_lutea.AAC.1